MAVESRIVREAVISTVKNIKAPSGTKVGPTGPSAIRTRGRGGKFYDVPQAETTEVGWTDAARAASIAARQRAHGKMAAGAGVPAGAGLTAHSTAKAHGFQPEDSTIGPDYSVSAPPTARMTRFNHPDTGDKLRVDLDKNGVDTWQHTAPDPASGPGAYKHVNRGTGGGSLHAHLQAHGKKMSGGTPFSMPEPAAGMSRTGHRGGMMGLGRRSVRANPQPDLSPSERAAWLSGKSVQPGGQGISGTRQPEHQPHPGPSTPSWWKPKQSEAASTTAQAPLLRPGSKPLRQSVQSEAVEVWSDAARAASAAARRAKADPRGEQTYYPRKGARFERLYDPAASASTAPHSQGGDKSPASSSELRAARTMARLHFPNIKKGSEHLYPSEHPSIKRLQMAMARYHGAGSPELQQPGVQSEAVVPHDKFVPVQSFKDDVQRKLALKSVMGKRKKKQSEQGYGMDDMMDDCPDEVRDVNGYCPDDPEYDPSTRGQYDPSSYMLASEQQEPIAADPEKGLTVAPAEDMPDGLQQYAKEEVNYRYAPDPTQSCGKCVHFIAPGACELVAGMIRPVDTCDKFAPQGTGTHGRVVPPTEKSTADDLPTEQTPMGRRMAVQSEAVVFPRRLASEAVRFPRQLASEGDATEVTPPGGERVVRALKKQPGVDNPWAVAWAMKNKGQLGEDEEAHGRPHSMHFPSTGKTIRFTKHGEVVEFPDKLATEQKTFGPGTSMDRPTGALSMTAPYSGSTPEYTSAPRASSSPSTGWTGGFTPAAGGAGSGYGPGGKYDLPAGSAPGSSGDVGSGYSAGGIGTKDIMQQAEGLMDEEEDMVYCQKHGKMEPAGAHKAAEQDDMAYARPMSSPWSGLGSGGAFGVDIKPGRYERPSGSLTNEDESWPNVGDDRYAQNNSGYIKVYGPVQSEAVV